MFYTAFVQLFDVLEFRDVCVNFILKFMLAGFSHPSTQSECVKNNNYHEMAIITRVNCLI